MESQQLPLASVAAHLRQAFPGEGVIHIGAGAGVGDMHSWRSWGVAYALLVDANAQRCAWLESETGANPGWQFAHTVIAETDGVVTYYEASNPAESGLLDPDALTPFWPVLKCAESKPVTAVSLDRLLEERGLGWRPQWLIIDCLPAPRILAGAKQVLEHCSFIWLRAVLAEESVAADGTGLAQIQPLLEPYGFHLRAVQPGINPAVGEALFVRDWQTAVTRRFADLNRQIHDLGETRDHLAQKCTAMGAEMADLQSQRDAQATLAAEHLSRSDALQQESAALAAANADLEKRLAAAEAEKASIAKTRDEQTGLVAKHLAQIEDLNKELDAIKGEKADLDRRLSASDAATSELTADRDAQAKLAAESQAQNKALKESSAALTTAKADLEKRLATVEAEKASIAKTRDEQSALVTEQLIQIQTLTKDLDASRAAKTDLEKRLASVVAEKAAIAKTRDEKSALVTEQLTQIQTLTKDLDASRAAKADLEKRLTSVEAQKAELSAAKTKLEQRLTTMEADKAKAALARDEQAKLAAERLAQNEALQKEKSALSISKTELEKRLGTLETEKSALVKARDEQSKLAAERKEKLDKAEQAVADQSARLRELESREAESTHRQQMLHEEMLKAEAQIDLIKDVLLREPGI